MADPADPARSGSAEAHLAELDRLRAAATPDHERVRTAVRSGDVDAAEAALDSMLERFRSLQDYSINWVTSLLSFIGRELGEDAVEAALRQFGDDHLAARRAPAPGATSWADLPAEVRARAVIRPMVANGASVEVDADDERIELRFRCGSGGRLVDEGRYGHHPNDRSLDEVGTRPAYLVLEGDGPVTFGRPGLPVYCAHCSVNNELQPAERDGAPTTVEWPTRLPGEPCVHHVYRDGHRGRPD